MTMRCRSRAQGCTQTMDRDEACAWYDELSAGGQSVRF